MKIVIAMDSFKGSLSSTEAGYAVADGIKRVFPEAETIVFPVADGGEGTTDALVSGMKGEYRTITVSDPLGRPISARYGVLQDHTAVIEMAAASGLTLLQPSERNPLFTTTYGFGEMIADAIRQGCRHFILGIGGSATNDCGIGCLQALGFGIHNVAGQQVPYGARGIAQVHSITSDGVIPELRECKFYVASDVTNPLCGERGCSAVFAPQKGADAVMVAAMERDIRHYADVVRQYIPEADPEFPGSGAAGGLGYALHTFLKAELKRGIDVVIQQTGIENAIKTADLVVTGEGRLDAQTVFGKAPVGIALTAKRYHVPVIAFCGCVGAGAEACNQNGIDAFFPILRQICTLEEALETGNGRQNLSDTVEQVFRLMKIRT